MLNVNEALILIETDDQKGYQEAAQVLRQYIERLEHATRHVLEDADDSLDGITVTQASVNECKRALGLM
jgi:hypothetical protein